VDRSVGIVSAPPLAVVSRFPIFRAVCFLPILVPCLAPNPVLRGDETSPAPYLKTELYFGPVDGGDWADFLAREVTPRFPQGLTWLKVQGQWRDAKGSIRKLDSRLLILIYVRSAAANKNIEAIRSDFKIRFHQQSVLRVTEQVDASF
jgi:hypothetical protein